MATFYDHVRNTPWMSESLTWLSTNLPCKDACESTLCFLKETWKLKDVKQLTHRERSCTISFGNEETTSSNTYLSNMFNYKGSVDITSEMQNPTHFLAPQGNFTVSIPMKISGLLATYRLSYPKTIPDELKLQYEGLEHWLFSLSLLSPSQTPTIAFGVTPICHTFSVPFKIKLAEKESAFTVANWSVGLTREASIFSFGFHISQSITITEDTETIDSAKKKRIIKETETTASCKVETGPLSASADWNGQALNCSFKQEEDMGFSITSQCQIDLKDATKNIYSVGVGKKWKYKEKLHRGLHVTFDTRDVTTIIFSQSLTKNFSLQVSAKVDSRVINNSRLRAEFSFT